MHRLVAGLLRLAVHRLLAVLQQRQAGLGITQLAERGAQRHSDDDPPGDRPAILIQGDQPGQRTAQPLDHRLYERIGSTSSR